MKDFKALGRVFEIIKKQKNKDEETLMAESKNFITGQVKKIPVRFIN